MSTINLDVWSVDTEWTFNGEKIARTATFENLYPVAFQPNRMLDTSILMNKTERYTDNLSVGRRVSVRKVGTGEYSFNFFEEMTIETYYFFTYTMDSPSAKSAAAYEMYDGIGGDDDIKRIGEDVQFVNQFPDVSAIVKMATANYWGLVMVEYATISSISKAEGVMDKIIGFSDVRTEAYSTVLDYINNDDTWFNTHIVVRMYLLSYYGTSSNRDSSSYITLACYRELRDTNPNMLLCEADVSSWHDNGHKCLQQGGEAPMIRAKSDKNVDIYFYRCNHNYWSLGVRYWDNSDDIVITAYIRDKLSFTSAYYSYWATGQNFTGDPNLAQYGDKEDADKGSTSPDGITNGGRGSTAADRDNNQSTDPDEMGNPDFDPDIDPNNYVDDVNLPHPTLSTIDVFNKTYAMTSVQLGALADELWNGDDDMYGEIVDGLKLMGQCPMNGVIDVRMYPFDIVSKLQPSAVSSLIKIGRTTLNCYGYRLTEMSSAIIDLGSCSFYKKFKNFLDYNPYTEGRLYLPYCGIVPIDTAEFMGRTITAKLIVDVITGACTAVVFADGYPVAQSHGSCGIGIPITGDDAAKYTASVLSNFVGGISETIQAGGSLAAGLQSPSGMGYFMPSLLARQAGMSPQEANHGAPYASQQYASTGSHALNAASQFWQAYNTPIQYVSAGAASPSCATWLPQKAYFLIDRPVQLERSGYGHTIGYACMIFAPLKDFNGYTVCTNVDTSGFAQATQGERDELKLLLESGVFL